MNIIREIMLIAATVDKVYAMGISPWSLNKCSLPDLISKIDFSLISP